MGQAVPQKDEGGSVTRYMGTVTDITQLKEAEQNLREGEERFRKLIETTFDAIVIHDDGLILDVNREAGSLFGYRPEDILGRNVLDLVSPQSRETVEQRMASGSEDAYEAVVIRRDGSTSIVEIVGRPSVWQGRQVRVVALRDITQRRLAEGEIQKLAAFPRHNPNPVFAFRDDGELIYFNDAASELARSLGEDHPLGILPPDVATLVRQALDAPDHNRELESVVRQRTFAWTFFAIPDQRVIHAYAAEITSRLELENQLRHAQKMESIGQLAAGVAHDFNNILTIIQGHANLLLTYSDLPNDSSESLKEISVAAERAARLTRQLLTFSRRQVRQPRPIDLNELIRSLTPMLHASIDPAVTLQINCSTQLPTVHADAGMLEQVVMNLATNARDALSNDGRIAISTASTRIDSQHAQSHAEARAGHFVCLTVADNGSGMSSDTISHLFEPFFTTKEVGKGTGLGLATVYGIVKLHQGWIEVQSTPDKGSTFRVFLPVLASATSPAGGSTTFPDASAGGETVLVVEDEPGLRHLVRNILNRHGYKVLTASSGVEALKVWEEHRRNIQLLLTDMIMPDGLSGRDLAERLIAQDRHLKVIYTSGYSMDVVGKGSALKEGYNFLQKPYQPPVLAKAIRDCLDS
jgi:PAS domain S-box-containing protein